MSNLIRVGDVEPGNLMLTKEGNLCFKTEYHTFNNCKQCDCYAVASGEAAHFPNGDDELVEAIDAEALVAENKALRTVAMWM